jgi:hypothetical protein
MRWLKYLYDIMYEKLYAHISTTKRTNNRIIQDHHMQYISLLVGSRESRTGSRAHYSPSPRCRHNYAKTDLANAFCSGLFLCSILPILLPHHNKPKVRNMDSPHVYSEEQPNGHKHSARVSRDDKATGRTQLQMKRSTLDSEYRSRERRASTSSVETSDSRPRRCENRHRRKTAQECKSSSSEESSSDSEDGSTSDGSTSDESSSSKDSSASIESSSSEEESEESDGSDEECDTDSSECDAPSTEETDSNDDYTDDDSGSDADESDEDEPSSEDDGSSSSSFSSSDGVALPTMNQDICVRCRLSFCKAAVSRFNVRLEKAYAGMVSNYFPLLCAR